MEVTKEITLDVIKPKALKMIIAKQNDTASRFLKVSLTNNGVPILIKPESTVAFNVKRADGQVKVLNGRVNDDGTVTVSLSKWVLEIYGIVQCEISVIETDTKLTSLKFAIFVEENIYNDEDLIEDENYDLLVSMINQCSEKSKACDTAVSNVDDSIDSLNERIANGEFNGKDYALTEADKQEIAEQVPGTTDYLELENRPIKQIDLTGHGRDNPLRLEVLLGENPYRGMYEITGEGYYELNFMNMRPSAGSANLNCLNKGALLTLYLKSASDAVCIEKSEKGIYEIKFSGGGYGRSKLLNEEEVKELIRGIYIPVKSISVNGTAVQPDSKGSVEILTNTALIRPSQTEVTLEPNKFYQFEEVAELNITLAAGKQNTVNEYMFEFVSGATPTNLTLPADVKWVSDVTVEANKKYQVSILNNIGIMAGADI